MAQNKAYLNERYGSPSTKPYPSDKLPPVFPGPVTPPHATTSASIVYGGYGGFFFSLDPSQFILEASEFATPTRQNNLRRGQAYYGASQQPGALVTPLTADIDSGGTQLLGMSPQKEFMAQTRFAGDALMHLE